MLPLIIGGVVFVALVNALASDTKKTKSEFKNKDIIATFAKFFEPEEEIKAKIHATKTINKALCEFTW